MTIQQNGQHASSSSLANYDNNNNNNNVVNTYNPEPHVIPEGENAIALEVVGATATEKLVIIMVGLPATGKTGFARRICRYLNFFFDLSTEIFSVAEKRREIVGGYRTASFYDPNNAEAMAQRSQACNEALDDLIVYMSQDDSARVGVFDATNTTKERRRHVIEKLKKAVDAKFIFLEIICEDKEMLEGNIKEVKSFTPDYKDLDPDEASRDYTKRREMYRSVYEPLDESEGSFIKAIDCKRFVVNNIRGYLPLKVVHFVMNLHTRPRTFYFTRHGQSEYNQLGKIGGDSGLSKAGVEYARRLATYAKETIAKRVITDETKENNGQQHCEVAPARLWTSTLRRTKETAQFIEHPTILHKLDDDDEEGAWMNMRPMAKRNLDELYAGMCDGMTYKEIEKVYPEEFERRQEDKLAYRYPRGESYMDVILRLEPLAHEMERTREPLLIVGHQGILRILYAYFKGLPRDNAPYVSIPLNTIIHLTPHAHCCAEERICLMNKEEMLKDGQDEPITSMPMKNGTKGVQQPLQNDPVMDAPSC